MQMQVVETPQEMIELGLFGGILFRRFRFFRNQTMPGHQHNYDHASLIVKGEFIYTLSGVDHCIKAPGVIHVPAEALHEMRCLSEHGETWCAFPARDETGEIGEYIAQASKGKVPYWSE